jgi:hypothetical protein
MKMGRAAYIFRPSTLLVPDHVWLAPPKVRRRCADSNELVEAIESSTPLHFFPWKTGTYQLPTYIFHAPHQHHCSKTCIAELGTTQIPHNPVFLQQNCSKTSSRRTVPDTCLFAKKTSEPPTYIFHAPPQ